MTNYIVNKTTTEVYAVVSDSLANATKAVEQGNGELMGHNVSYNSRPQPSTPAPLPQPK